MDRNWMNHRGINDRKEPLYIASVDSFLEFSFIGREDGTKLRCTCLNCNFQIYHDRVTMKCHLIAKGIVRDYNPWVHHGEVVDQRVISSEDCEYEISSGDDDVNNDNFMVGDDLTSLLFDATRTHGDSCNTELPHDDMPDVSSEQGGSKSFPKEFHKLMQDLESELYPGCKIFKRLEFIVILLHIKVSGKWTDHSFSLLLKALHMAFNYDASFPKCSYEASKYTKTLGLDYVKIDACINHCALFWKENEGKDECPKCGASRWKERQVSQGVGDSDTTSEEPQNIGRREPQLVLRHFPLIPRLQRMFASSKLR